MTSLDSNIEAGRKLKLIPAKYKELYEQGKISLEEALSHVPSTATVVPATSADKPVIEDKYGGVDYLKDTVGSSWDSKFANPEYNALVMGKQLTPEQIKEKEAKASEYMDMARKSTREIPTGLREATDLYNEIAYAKEVQKDPVGYAKRKKEIEEEMASIDARRQRAGDYMDKTDNYGIAVVGNVLGQPENILSTVGGLAGGALAGTLVTPATAGIGTAPAVAAGMTAGSAIASAPGAKIAYDAALTEALRANVPVGDAKAFATWMATSEYALEFVGGATGGAGKAASVPIKQLLKNFLKGAVHQAAEEGATELIQEGGTKAIATVAPMLGHEQLGDYANSQLPDTLLPTGKSGENSVLGNVSMSAAAGLVSAGALTAPHTALSVVDAVKQKRIKLQADFDSKQKELDDLVDQNLTNTKETEANIKEADVVMPKDTTAPVQGELFDKPTRADGEPMIQDMFSGGVQSASQAETSALESRQALKDFADGKPLPESDAQFEQRKSREAIAATKIEDTQQADFETHKAKELARRAEHEDATNTIANKRSILDASSIKQEANKILNKEIQTISRRVGNRTPEGLARLPATIAQYTAKRLPELVASVKSARVQTVRNAQNVINTTKQRETSKQLLKDYNEVSKAEDKRNAKDNPKPNLNNATQVSLELGDQTKQADLFGTLPNEVGYTGNLTEEQAVEEAKKLGAIRAAKVDAGNPTNVTKELAAQKAVASQAEVDKIAQSLQPGLEKADVANTEAKAKAYAVAEDTARKSITKSVNESMAGKPVAERATAIAQQLVAWREANPKDKSIVKAPKTEKLLTPEQRVQKRYDLAEASNKAAETKAENKQIDIFRKKGMTVTEAIEALKARNESGVATKLSPSDDAAARELLRGTTQPTSEAKAKTPQKSSLRESSNRPQRRNTDMSLADVIEGAITDEQNGLKDIVQYMADSPRTSPSYSILAKVMAPIVNKLNIGLKTLSQEGIDNKWEGYYDPNTNTVYLGSSHPELVLHEVLHAILRNIINLEGPFKNSNTAKALVRRLDALRDHSISYIKNNPTKFTEAETTWIKDHVQDANGNPVADGAVSNVDEFVSYSGTSDMFNSIMSKIPAKGLVKPTITSVLKQLVDTIKTTMGWNIQNTALEQVFSASTKLLDLAASDTNAVNQAATEVADSANMYPLKRTSKSVTIPVIDKEVTIASMDTRNSVMGRIKDFFTGGYGNSKNVTEILERSKGLVNEYAQRAEARFRSMESELRKQAGAAGSNYSELRKEFNADATSLETNQGESGIVEQSAAFSAKYGHAARNYFDARREIDSLSKMIIDERLKDPRPLTDKELGSYLKMKEELGRYYTRLYAVNLKGVGDSLLKATKKALDRFKSNNANEDEAKLAQTYMDAVEVIKNSHVLIPDDEALSKYGTDRLEHLADVWNIKTGATEEGSTSKESLIEAISNFRDNEMTGAEEATMQDRAEQLANELLDPTKGSALVTYYRGSKEDRTVVEHRENVPKAIRKLLGEYEDTSLKIMTTVLSQSGFLFKQSALREIYNSERGKGDKSKILSPKEVAERSIDTTDWKRLKGEGYGMLDGMYVENTLADRLEEISTIEASFKQAASKEDTKGMLLALGKTAFDNYIKANGVVKAGQLVWNPANAALNFVGGGGILLSNGNISPVTAAKTTYRAGKVAAKMIVAQVTGVIDPDVSQIIRTEQVDSSFMGSISRTELEDALLVVKAQLGDRSAQDSISLWKKTKEGARFGKEVYAMADVVWKIANFYYRLDFLTEYNKANGGSMTEEAIERQAASDNSATNFSYARTPSIVKNLDRGTPLYIASYMYQSVKAPISNMALGMADIKQAFESNTPEAKNMMLLHGVKRAAGAAAAITIAQTVARVGLGMLSQYVLGGDDEDKNQKEIDGLRSLMKEYEKYDEYFIAGTNSKNNTVLFSLSRTDPFGPASKFFSLYQRGAPLESYEEAFSSMFIKNRYGSNLLGLFAGLADSDGNTSDNPRLKRAMPKVWDLVSSMSENSAKSLDAIMPSWLMKSMDPENEGFDSFSTAVKYAGGQMTEVDVAKNLGYVAKDFTFEQAAASTELLNRVKDSTDLSVNKITSKFIEASNRERKAYDKVSSMVEALRLLGNNDSQIASTLKSESKGRMSDRDIQLIMNGTYSIKDSRVLTDAKLDALNLYIANSKGSVTNKINMKNNFNNLLRALNEGKVTSSRE